MTVLGQCARCHRSIPAGYYWTGTCDRCQAAERDAYRTLADAALKRVACEVDRADGRYAGRIQLAQAIRATVRAEKAGGMRRALEGLAAVAIRWSLTVKDDSA